MTEKENEDVKIRSIALFLGHWYRIFGSWHPQCEQIMEGDFGTNETNVTDDTYFWRSIVTEVLEVEGTTLDLLVDATQLQPNFWRACLSKHSDISMPLLAGQQLLLLHEQLRPDLQGKEKDS